MTDYTMLPDTGRLSGQLRVCLQEGDENPRDFTSLFNRSLFNLSTDTLPQVIRWERKMNASHHSVPSYLNLCTCLQCLHPAECQTWAPAAHHATVWNAAASAAACCEFLFLQPKHVNRWPNSVSKCWLNMLIKQAPWWLWCAHCSFIYVTKFGWNLLQNISLQTSKGFYWRKRPLLVEAQTSFKV